MRGKKQGEVCDKIGISQTALSQIENGVKTPRITTVVRLATFLDVPLPVLYLMSFEDTDVSEKYRSKFNDLYPVILAIIKQIFNLKDEEDV